MKTLSLRLALVIVAALAASGPVLAKGQAPFLQKKAPPAQSESTYNGY